MDDKVFMVGYKELKAVYGIPYSRQHIDRLVKDGSFPQPIKLGQHRLCRKMWWLADIREWLRTRPSTNQTNERA